MNPVIVIGIAHHNTLGVIRSLGRKGLSSVMYPIIAGGKDNYVTHSRHIVPSNLTTIDGISQLLDALNRLTFPTVETEHAPSSRDKAIIICCWDAAISLLDRNRNSLEDRFIIPSASGPYGNISSLMNKSLQFRAAADSGLNVPETLCYSKTVETEHAPSPAETWNLFPCIIKPSDSTQGAKTEIRICRNTQDLLSGIGNSSCSSFLVQPFIDKSIEFQLIGCSLSGGNQVIIPGYTTIIRQPANTNTGFLRFQPVETEHAPSSFAAVRHLLRNIGYSGLFSVEFLRDKSGNDYFLEINLRNDGNAICVTDAGVNLPYIWYAYNAGIDYTSEAASPCHSLYCMPEYDDIIFLLKGKLSPLRWIKDIHRTTSFMEYDRDDKAPFLKRTKGFIAFLRHRILHKSNPLPKLKTHLLHYTWDLAFIDCTDDILCKPLRELHPRVVRNPYRHKWFADPFILAVDDSFITLLVEEFDRHIGRGRIAELKIDRTANTIVHCTIVLDLPTHHSFPAIYRRDDTIYIHPESSHSGKSVLYKYDPANRRVTPHRTLLRQPIADAIIHRFGDNYYMFATLAPHFNGKTLQVYKSTEFDGKYEHCDTLTFHSDIARMAGDFIQIRDTLYRPAQDCDGGQYGKRIVLLSVDRNHYDKTKVVNKLTPSGVKYAGVHTVNQHNGVRVIDLKRYDYPLLYAIKERLK